ncbi:F0F1 ATP synthase subunit B [Mucisphaera sp.]|uniref:F0F1 ATP synthase subunit B n=1 Tax=Mucisphaera sp. TaxID=2913024 RepID=UPI003D0F30ED
MNAVANRIIGLGLAATASIMWMPSVVQAASESDDAKGETPFLLNVDTGSAVWNLIVFLLLFTFLYKVVWPQVLNGLKAREQKMRDDLLSAESAAKEAALKADELKQQLAEANREAQRIIDESRSEAQRAAAEIKASADAELAQVKARAEADIRSAKEQAVAEIYDRTAELATQVAGKILQREISADDQRQLIDESLTRLKDQAQRN